MRVRNVVGTGNHTCNCDSWIDHWEKYSGYRADMCAEASCRNPASVGAHVQIVGFTGMGIIPLCQYHNMAGGTFEIVDGCPVISTNLSDTCG